MKHLALPVEEHPLARNATSVASTGTLRAIVLKEAGLAVAMVVEVADTVVATAVAAVVVLAVVVVVAARHATRAVAMVTCRETAPRARSATTVSFTWKS